MSTEAEKAPHVESERKRPANRRKPAGKVPRKPAADEEEETTPKAAVDAAPREPRPPRPPAVPVPDSFLGKSATGVVHTLIRKGRFNFGFITIGEGENAPSIYFNPSCLAEPKVYMRRGYEVEFVCAKDEEGRFTAKDIKLTSAGEQTKAENDIAYQAKRAERLAAASVAAPAEAAGETKVTREPRVRKPRGPLPEGAPLVLRVTCQGHAEEKLVNVHSRISIGRLKGVSMQAFDAPLAYNIYHVPSDGSELVFLTKTVLKSLSNNDKIHLAEPADKERA